MCASVRGKSDGYVGARRATIAALKRTYREGGVGQFVL